MEKCLMSDKENSAFEDYLPLRCYRCNGLDTSCKDFYNGEQIADVIEFKPTPMPDEMYASRTGSGR